MSAIETLKLKLLTGDYTFSDPPLKLVDGEPYLPNRSMTLQAARSMQYPPARFKDEARKRAKGLFYSVFEWQCGEHGLTVHHTATGRCAQCYKESKRRTTPARSEAQARGDAVYMAGCLVHGVVEHSTARGLCLSCYNTLGQPRPLATNPAGYYVNREGKIKNCS